MVNTYSRRKGSVVMDPGLAGVPISEQISDYHGGGLIVIEMLAGVARSTGGQTGGGFGQMR